MQPRVLLILLLRVCSSFSFRINFDLKNFSFSVAELMSLRLALLAEIFVSLASDRWCLIVVIVTNRLDAVAVTKYWLVATRAKFGY